MKKFIFKYWPLILIFIVWFIFAKPYVLNGLVPFPSRHLVSFFAPWNTSYGMPVKNGAMPDVVTQLYPWKKITIDSWRSGQIPAWNPYQFSGYPLLANVQSSVFTPLNLLFFILPFIDAWSTLILLQPLLAGLGMYAFLRSLNQSRVGAIIGSTSFMFCGFITVWMAYGTLGYAALTLPWILYGIVGWFKEPRKLWALLIVLSVVFSFTSGHVQTSLYVVGASVLFIVYQGVATKQVASLWKGILFICTGIVLVTPQILPTIRFYEQSIRSEYFQKIEVIPWNYLPTILAPDVLGNSVTRNDWFGHYAEWASFAGVVPFLFAIFIVVLPIKKPRLLWYFVCLGTIAVLLAFPTPVLDIIFRLHIPVLSTSAFSRIILLLSFSVASLSGFGFDALIAMWQKGNYRFVVLYAGAWIAIITLVWIMFIGGNLFWIASIDEEKLSVAERNFVLPSLLALTSVILMVVGFWKRKRLRTAILTCFVVLTIFDMLRFSVKWMPFDSKEFVYPTTPMLKYLSIEGGFDRVFGNFGNEGQSVFGLYGIEGYDPLYIRRYGEFISAAGDGLIGKAERSTVLIDRQGKFTKRILDMLAVKFILHSKGDARNVWAFPYWNYPSIVQTPIYSDEHYEVYRNEGALPRAYLVPSYVVEREDQKILDLLLTESIDLTKTVILEETPEVFAKETMEADPYERVRITQYTPNKIRISVDTHRPGFLILTDPYFPGWNAFINGSKTKIYRANYAFRAITIPKGVWRVDFSYDHWLF